MMMGNVLRIFESAFMQRQSGRMEEDTWQGYQKLIERGVSSSIFPLYWQLRREMHDHRFVSLVDTVAEHPDTRKMFD